MPDLPTFRLQTGKVLDQCLYLLCDGEELVGSVRIYVDDGLICGNELNPRFQQAYDALRKPFSWCTEYLITSDFYIILLQTEVDRKLGDGFTHRQTQATAG